MHQFPITRRTLTVAMLTGLTGIAGAQQADQYPNKPIKIIVPTTPGGGIDNGARVLGERLREAWGQSVVIENRDGAAGSAEVDCASQRNVISRDDAAEGFAEAIDRKQRHARHVP